MEPQTIRMQYHQSINPATALPVDCWLGVVPSGAEYELVEAIETHSVVGSDGSAVTVDVVKASPGTAPGSGTSLLGTAFNLKSTANTPVHKYKGGTSTAALASSQVTRTVRSGQQIGLNFTGTLTASAGVSVTLVFALRRKGSYR